VITSTITELCSINLWRTDYAIVVYEQTTILLVKFGFAFPISKPHSIYVHTKEKRALHQRRAHIGAYLSLHAVRRQWIRPRALVISRVKSAGGKSP
jgi:hypothetical protein